MRLLLWVVLGALAPLLLESNPSPWLMFSALGAGLAVLRFRKLRLLALLLLPMSWSLLHLDRNQLLRSGAPFPVEAQTVLGTVVNLPVEHGSLTEFLLRPDEHQSQFITWPAPRRLVLVRWYQPAEKVRAGDRWLLTARLRPPRARVNFHGPDRERRYFVQGISAIATLSGDGGKLLATSTHGWSWQAWRDRLRDRLRVAMVGQAGAGLVLALAVADRSDLGDELREAMIRTGTGHLLAISGLHIGLVALFAYGLGRILLAGTVVVGLRIATLHAAWALALAAAATYAGLAGFGTSTRRALVMLSVPALCVLARRAVSPWCAWLLALAAVLILQPLAPLEEGFWLSFGAVGVLIATFAPLGRRPGKAGALLRAQFAISLVMLPVGMQLFQQVSAGGLITNLAVIPWVSLITLPLTLLGLVALILDLVLAEPVLQMAATSGAWLEAGLGVAVTWLSSLHWPTHRPGVLSAVLAVAGCLLLMLPRACAFRWMAAILVLPAVLPPGSTMSKGEARLDLLDVGQGLAATVRTREHLLLYDTGPGQPGEWDLYHSVIRPAFAGYGRLHPDLIVISHGDLDHAGGLVSLSGQHGDERLLANLPGGSRPVPACHDRHYWDWDGVRFRVLHPTRFLPYLGNASSCVIGIRTAGASILLPGDIPSVVEQRLVRIEDAGWDFLLAPHHGSQTSSSGEFLAWSNPRAVLIAAGAGNRFGFPHTEVIERIQAAGASIWTTADCGALSLRLRADGRVEARSARRTQAAPWRWPAGPECP